MIKVNDDLLLIKLILDESYVELGKEWNQISSLNRTFKKDNKVFFCELIEEVETIEEEVVNEEITVIEDTVENPIN